MPVIDIIWDLPGDPDGKVRHIAEHGLVPSDVEHAVKNPRRRSKSRSSGRPIIFGRTPSGEEIAVVYEETDEGTIYPVTAYQVEE
jgi:hypothetical protein